MIALPHVSFKIYKLSFKNLQLIEPLLEAIVSKGYTKPTPVQEQAIPVILNKRDLLGCAQTGTGKTAAFAIPLLQLMEERRRTMAAREKKLRLLVLTPTRELAVQVEESFRAYGRFLQFRSAVVFGGVSQYQQVSALRRGVDILVATPGRLIDLLNQRHLSLDQVEFFVLDEADRMLDMGFVHDVKKIISQLPVKKQSSFFSATMPQEIKQLAGLLLRNPVKVEVIPQSSGVDMIQQSLYYVDKKNKSSLLCHLLEYDSIETAIVFTKTKHGADKLARQLHRAGVNAEAIHGNKSQRERQRALANFKYRRSKVLVATDIAARGIDIDQLGHVFNYDLPQSPETYVHRIGRTGRAGASGTAISFCDYEEKILLSDIQKFVRRKIDVVKDHPFDVAMMHPHEFIKTQQTFPVRKRSVRKGQRTFRQA